MRYEQTLRLSNREFKRLVGVQRHTFDEIVKVLQDAASNRQTRGCSKKLCLEDQALVCLTYWRGAGDAPPPVNIELISISPVLASIRSNNLSYCSLGRKYFSQFREVSVRRKKVIVDIITKTENSSNGCD